MAGYSPASVDGVPLKLNLPFYLLSIINGEYKTKLWGTEYWLVNTDRYCFKVLEIKPGFQCSLHYHNVKDETFIVYEGQILLEQRDVRAYPFEELLSVGSKRHIASKTPHRFRAVNGPAIVFEISTHHDDADVVRIVGSQAIPIPEIPRCIA